MIQLEPVETSVQPAPGWNPTAPMTLNTPASPRPPWMGMRSPRRVTPCTSPSRESSAIPAVFYDVGTATRNISNIRVNYRLGIERVVEYLHDLGHRRLAFIGHHAKLGPTSEREKAFTEAVARYDGEMEWRTAADQDGLEGGRQAARALLADGFRPTAIACVNDVMAVGVLRELRDQRLRVPQDVSVTGFDNVTLSEFCFPRLTTVHIPRERIGHLVFEVLGPGQANGKPAGREIVLDPELVVRESTGPVR
jgi:DNA-binding LacI/PurR family transcriptional regulator